MSDDFQSIDEYDRVDWDDFYPEEALEAFERSKKFEHENESTNTSTVTNDVFIQAIFGDEFTEDVPLVCKKTGDPDEGGWAPRTWPCDTADSTKNWYFLPGLYKPESTGRYRAKKALAVAVYAVALDDVGTKVPMSKLDDCSPSWVIETSPGNHQAGFILQTPVDDLELAEQLKTALIAAGLCDAGATGASARWMRLPVAINGKPKYGSPPFQCKLITWQPNVKYTVAKLYKNLNLQPVKNSDTASPSSHSQLANGIYMSLAETKASKVIQALHDRGLYKKNAGTGKHEITCPWVKGHTDALDSGAYYYDPSDQYPTGGFKCFHSHGSLFHVKDLLTFLQINTNDTANIVNAKPQKLPSSLKPVPMLDISYLPDAIRDAAVDLADRLQCPIDYLVVAMVSAAGAVIGNRAGIFPLANDESWEVYPTLWGGIVGDPGSKKTPSMQAAHRPLRHIEDMANQTFAQAMQQHEIDTSKYERDLAQWQRNKTSLKPTEPKAPKKSRLVVNDTTYQALGTILADNARGVLAIGDELTGLLRSLDSPGQEAARGFYLSGWSGTQGYSFDRVGRGHVSLARYCLSVFGGFQPDRIKSYVREAQRGSSTNDGMLQRFQLLVWPDPLESVVMVDRPPNHAAIEVYFKAVMRLNSIAASDLPDAKSLPSGSLLLHFTAQAQQAFNAWYIKNEEMLSSGKVDPARQSHFAKYRSLVPALALLFHLLDGHAGPVAEGCVLKAISYAKHLKKHANRIYASVSGHDNAAIRLLAERLLDGQMADGFTCRTLMLKGWSGLSNKEHAQAALDALVEFGWLVETEIRSGGRPTVKYSLNQGATTDLL